MQTSFCLFLTTHLGCDLAEGVFKVRNVLIRSVGIMCSDGAVLARWGER